MNCEKCNDTGSLSKNVTGYLDCPYCGAAEERMRVEAWARRAAPGAGLIDVWTIYQHGKAAVAPDLVGALRNLVAASDAYSTVHAPDEDDVGRMVKYAEAFDKARAVLAAVGSA